MRAFHASYGMGSPSSQVRSQAARFVAAGGSPRYTQGGYHPGATVKKHAHDKREHGTRRFLLLDNHCRAHPASDA